MAIWLPPKMAELQWLPTWHRYHDFFFFWGGGDFSRCTLIFNFVEVPWDLNEINWSNPTPTNSEHSSLTFAQIELHPSVIDHHRCPFYHCRSLGLLTFLVRTLSPSPCSKSAELIVIMMHNSCCSQLSSLAMKQNLSWSKTCHNSAILYLSQWISLSFGH